ncbi:hypothetical protein NEOLEDRAFT_401886 [Neolentinus lepideus HHB14362 ss-1]|uniref:Hydrophobin n=1 Tax=Neolentinus lepideus HHB14362 ss-1 TaxID=1314782 RepID=A0A165SB06_9AGAM|nr:hypothetical protein NEOLEDRAFT_401886 [Neolentinus lepideus HHB14362 ss-1]
MYTALIKLFALLPLFALATAAPHSPLSLYEGSSSFAPASTSASGSGHPASSSAPAPSSAFGSISSPPGPGPATSPAPGSGSDSGSSPAPGPTTSQCNTGTVQCCQQLQSAGSPEHTTLSGLLGLFGDLANLPIGVGCSPIPVGGLAQGATCTATPVCCENNSSGGPLNLVSAGCVPITLDG